jgi:transglutaminase-like putative cysteine protease
VRPTILLFLLATLPLRAAEFSVRPAPAWVDRITVATDAPVAREHARWGIYDMLDDHQVRAGDKTESQYYRTVRKVLSPSGVQNASELSLDFDPSFQRLVIHEVALVRGAKRIDALDADDIRVLEKEDGSDNRIYDGERTAMIFIKDVRPGDAIDYSWSLEGANPILGGRYTDTYDLSSSVPSRRMRHRLLFPAGRPLHWRGRKPVGVAAGATNIYTWEAANVAALDVEDSVPSWFEPWSSVQVSEFGSWGEVARWSDALFVLDERSKAEVKTLADTFRAQHATRDARITAAIRFVQDDIRYLGIEMGRNSHEPHQPWETLEARWGDCKDKTLLLVALLRELGLDAHPALVNTRLQHRLAEKMPSPFLFDHVIAQVIDGGKTYWVDGTIADQGGALATLETPSDGHALVVSAATTGLTPIDTRLNGGTHVEQRYTTTSYTEPVKLEVRTTYSGTDADEMRAEIASLSSEDFAHDRINDLAVDQPKIEAAGAPKIVDDRAGNVIIVTEHYRVRDLWNDGGWTWYPRVLEAHLNRPDTMIRKMPLAFTWPLNVRQTVTFTFPEDVDVEQRTSATETSAFRYDYVVDRNGHTVTIRQSLRSKGDAIAAQDVPDHLTKLSGIWSEIGYRLSPDGARAPQGMQAAAATVPSSMKWGLGAFIVAMFAGATWSVATRKRRGASPLAPRFMFLPGEAPASALAIRTDDDITAHLAMRPCGCGARAYSLPERQHAKYAERELTIVTRQCAACGREQSVYFTAA